MLAHSEERVLHVQMVLKCADIGHLAAEPKTHKRWAYQLEEEFFRQVCSCADVTCCLARLTCGSKGLIAAMSPTLHAAETLLNM